MLVLSFIRLRSLHLLRSCFVLVSNCWIWDLRDQSRWECCNFIDNISSRISDNQISANSSSYVNMFSRDLSSTNPNWKFITNRFVGSRRHDSLHEDIVAMQNIHFSINITTCFSLRLDSPRCWCWLLESRFAVSVLNRWALARNRILILKSNS